MNTIEVYILIQYNSVFTYSHQELVSVYRCVRATWLSRRLLQMILSNGVILTYVISQHTGDVDRIFVDKSLLGKLSSDMPSDGKSRPTMCFVLVISSRSILQFYFVLYIQFC